MGFTHLNLASAYSAHYGVNRPEQLAAAASALGFEALAVTDRDGLYGAVKHIAACIREGIHPIVGVNLEIADMGRVVILAHGHTSGSGWSVICRAISLAHNSRGKERRPRLSLDELAAMIRENPSCSVLIGPQSGIASKVLVSPASAREELDSWLSAIPQPGVLAIEVVNHLSEPGSVASEEHARAMLRLADSAGVPAVITNAARYLEPDDALTADVLDSARHLEQLGLFAMQPNAQAWMKPTPCRMWRS